MSVWGKLIGGTLGLVSGGPVGAVFGVVLGHSVDASVPRWLQAANLSRTQDVFFEATFRLLGHLAKADGRVSEREVAAVEMLMDRLRLDAASRRRAVLCFNAGKRRGFDAGRELGELERHTRAHPELRRLALEMLLETALADGRLKPEGRAMLGRVARGLGIGEDELGAMLGRRGGATLEPSPYEILGVAPDAPLADVKRAYRRLMARHHPDKLMSRGLPPQMLEVAERKTREIRAAWEQVRRERGH